MGRHVDCFVRARTLQVRGKRFADLCFRARNIAVTNERKLSSLVLGEVPVVLRDIPDEFFQLGLWRVEPSRERLMRAVIGAEISVRRGDFFAANATVRTLRLRKGWSQIQLAKELGTSQSHVARIERGTENLVIGTCRRLCGVLGIDMNTLDQALRRQEVIAQAKAKR